MFSKKRSTSVSFTSYPDLEKPKDFIDSSINSNQNNLGYKIKLKDEKLLVKLTSKTSHMHLLSHRSEDFLAEWLQFSPATMVQVDSRIELEKLKMWANQCKKYKKSVFLRLSKKAKCNENSNNSNNLNCLIRRCLDILGASTSIIILAPIFIAIGIFIKVNFDEPILQAQWCIGKKGKLFCIYRFNDNLKVINLNSLNKLPQLFNILKGEMSFVGRFPWNLAQAEKMSLSEQLLLNISPGITASITEKKANECTSYLMRR
ncbi:MAG: heterocyst development glycosyltransferase HepC [Cyanobacteriota bacterium]|nr:heterocyst development glycosyltransferase HepC [Cyanobacteriota bacterium]